MNQPRHPVTRLQAGFTLIELMTVVTIAIIMMAIAVPSFKNFIASQRVKSASYEISTTLLLARSEAIKRNTNVTIAPSTANTWTAGWTVTAGAVTLQSQPAIDGITITTLAADGVTPASLANVVFKGTGRQTGSVTYWQLAGSTTTRCVRLDTAGVATAKSGACS
jgi:type IV fimbrial biogenesis protein FimT